MLSANQITFFNRQGYLHLQKVFSEQETAELADHLDSMIESWASRDKNWTGPWRQVYMDEQTEKVSKLVAMHDLHFYSEAWMRAVTNRNLAEAMGDLLGGPVELHHSTMHVKPPQTGQPFPMHQDWPFYPHADGRFVDVLVHLDDTCHENGEICFLPKSHTSGPLDHITQTSEGSCTPHLSTDRYRLEDTVPVPAKAGDVVCFSIHCVHGSYVNQTKHQRRMVRVGYRHPDNHQLGGQSVGRPGLMVCGCRPRHEGNELFSTAGPVPQET